MKPRWNPKRRNEAGLSDCPPGCDPLLGSSPPSASPRLSRARGSSRRCNLSTSRRPPRCWHGCTSTTPGSLRGRRGSTPQNCRRSSTPTSPTAGPTSRARSRSAARPAGGILLGWRAPLDWMEAASAQPTCTRTRVGQGSGVGGGEGILRVGEAAPAAIPSVRGRARRPFRACAAAPGGLS